MTFSSFNIEHEISGGVSLSVPLLMLCRGSLFFWSELRSFPFGAALAPHQKVYLVKILKYIANIYLYISRLFFWHFSHLRTYALLVVSFRKSSSSQF